MSRDMKNTIILWTAIFGGFAFFVAFPAIVGGAVLLGIVGALAYGAYKCFWNEDFLRRQAENFVIGTIAGDRSRGKIL
jgi:hypothetical protein